MRPCGHAAYVLRCFKVRVSLSYFAIVAQVHAPEALMRALAEASCADRAFFEGTRAKLSFAMRFKYPQLLNPHPLNPRP